MCNINIVCANLYFKCTSDQKLKLSMFCALKIITTLKSTVSILNYKSPEELENGTIIPVGQVVFELLIKTNVYGLINNLRCVWPSQTICLE